MKNNKLVIAFMFIVVLLASVFVANTPSNNSNTVVLSTKNTLVLSGEVSGGSVGNLIREAKRLDSKVYFFRKTPLYLFLNTPGGEIQKGIELIEALNGLERPVNTVTLFAASMGFQIVQSLNGQRLVLNRGVLMSHRAAGEFDGTFGGQKPSQVENRFAFWYSRLQEFDKQTVKRSNGKQTLESYQKAYSDELWLTGQQAVDGGYADKIVTVRCDSTLSGTTVHTASMFGFTIQYELDTCPINTTPLNIQLVAQKGVQISNEKAEEIKNKFLEQYNISTKFQNMTRVHW